MEPHEQSWVRLPLDGAFNVRELGGYPVANGDQTKFHRFLRADSLGRLTAWDAQFLYDYGVRAVVDLRDTSEVEDFPDQVIAADVAYANTPLLGFNIADARAVEQMVFETDFSMDMVYRTILENYEAIRACFRFIADAPPGCVLFHCSVGKDRTGILAMLLLSLAGVDKWDIVADYVQTRPNLMRDEIFALDWHDASNESFRASMESSADVIEHAYDLVELEHGGVESYLLECGVPDEVVASVRRRLLL
ncbi:MAG: tyrosine-protein phosphatase [Coriobacteriales bacterium]|nr:tyrosine-protein phosphatase [Coriobacteriales bacterium]